MADVRSLERRDLPEVAALYELVMRSGRSAPPPGLVPYFERLFFDQPWADPEYPGQVAVDGRGQIVAFQGIHARRGRFDGEPVRIACLGQLVAHPDARRQAIGRTLVREHLARGQELSITDTATPPVMRLGVLMGASISHVSCIGWMRVMRPLLGAHAVARAQRGARRRPAGTRLISAVDAAIARSAAPLAPPPLPDAKGEPLTPAALVEHLPLLSDHVRLHLDYDEPFVEWLFGELGRLRGLGTLTARLLRNRSGRPLGWYVCFVQPGGRARVLHVAASDRDIGRVLDHLLYEAWSAGAAVVQGRLEPRLLAPLGERRCLMLHRGGVLLYSDRAEILASIAAGDSLLTRMDGEWWAQDKLLDLSS